MIAKNDTMTMKDECLGEDEDEDEERHLFSLGF